MRKLILGIDFNNILFSSYYNESLINSNGVNVNAVKGFFFRVKSLKELFNPDYIILANDIGRDRTFRRKLFPGYKGMRQDHNPDIINQMKLTSSLTSLLGYPMINNELYEADDILGMVSHYAVDNDMNMIIVSTDKDLYQLVNEYTYIYSPKSREIIDTNWMYEKYKLTPQQWVELKMLMGDRSDNIPGIQGIGEVSALRLLHQFNTIENVYNHLGSIKESVRNALITGRKSLSLSRELVTIITDYNIIGLNQSMLENTGKYYNDVLNLIQELELHSLVNVMKYSLFLENNDRTLIDIA